MRSVRLKSVCYSEMDLLNPCQIYHVKIQVETESDAKVAKTLVFANSKWESLANLQPGWNQCDSWCLHIVSSSGWISTPRFVDEGNPPDIFLLQVGESNTYINIYIYTMIQTEKDLAVGHSGRLKKDTSLGMFCQAFFLWGLRTTVDAITWRLSDARIRRHHVLLFEAEDETTNNGWINPLLFFGGFINVVIWTTQAGVLRPIVLLEAALGDQCKGACRSMVGYHRSDCRVVWQLSSGQNPGHCLVAWSRMR